MPTSLGTEATPTYGGDSHGHGRQAKNSAEGTQGKAKEKLGDASDDRELQAEGKKDQSKADLKQAGEKVKDAFKS